MLRILHDTKIDFIRYWRVAVGITIAFVLAGLIPLVIFGVTSSIELTGGTLMQVWFDAAPDAAKLRSALVAVGIPSDGLQPYGSPVDYTIRAQNEGSIAEQAAGAERVARKIEGVLDQTAGAGKYKVVGTEQIGPRVGGELRRGAILAILASFVITLIYLAWRFEWRFGLAATIATMHDILATLAFIKILNLEISLTVIAAILTVIGYSLNDTIIIFDRVRENLRKTRRESLYDLLNRSVNETLPRSVLTHVSTLLATLTLLIWAGPVIRPFAWVMTFGIFTGTFSSIYVASPVLLWIEHKFPRSDVAMRLTPAGPMTGGPRGQQPAPAPQKR